MLQCEEGGNKLRKFLFKYLPYLPASLPVLLFCRLAELTVVLERETLLSRADWEAAVHEKILLEWVANDVKIIGIICYKELIFMVKKLSNIIVVPFNNSPFQRQSQSPLDN